MFYSVSMKNLHPSQICLIRYLWYNQCNEFAGSRECCWW